MDNSKKRKRKMQPYCMSSEKKIRPSTMDSSSYENYGHYAKKMRKDRSIERHSEVKRVRQQLKKQLRNRLTHEDDEL